MSLLNAFLATAATASVLSDVQSSLTAAKVQKFNARVAANNAAQERAFGQEEAERTRLEVKRQQARARAAAGGIGIDVGSTGVLDILRDNAITGELAALDALNLSESRARAFEGQSAGAAFQARVIRNNAPLSALTAGLRGGGLKLGERLFDR